MAMDDKVRIVAAELLEEFEENVEHQILVFDAVRSLADALGEEEEEARMQGVVSAGSAYLEAMRAARAHCEDDGA